MFSKNSKIRWLYVLVVITPVVWGGVVLMLRHDQSFIDPPPLALNVVITPRPMPTELNENFFTQVNECFIPVASVYGYALRITSGFRTIEEQAELYQQGRTVDGHIISWAEAGKSIHNYGYAVDVVDRWRGYTINWKRLAGIAEYCGLAQIDDAHFEYRGGLTTEQFVAGLTPSLLELPCAIMSERARAGEAFTRKNLQDCHAPEF